MMDCIKTHKKFLGLYLILMLLCYISEYYGSTYFYILKPFLVTSLLAYYVVKSRPQSRLIIVGLIFALLGDVFLLIPYDDMFLMGLSSFLVMHIFYILYFRMQRLDTKPFQWLVFVAILTIGFLSYTLFKPYLGKLSMPVSLYILVICYMVSSAVLRNTELKGYWMVVTGAFLFLVSDFLLAYRKFVDDSFLNSEAVLITYAFAQLFIVLGLLENNKLKP